jgi:Tfp pilus assembly protein PilN
MLIQINLNPAPGRSNKKKGGATGFTMPDFKQLAAKIKDPALPAGIVAWIASGMVLMVLWIGANNTLSGMQEEQARLESEARRFRTLIQQKRRAELLRDSLEAELTAIRAIDSDRYIWPHIMDEVTKALPDYTWIVSLNQLAAGEADATGRAPVRFVIDGRTSDLSAYTRFVRQLATSPWLTNVIFGAAQSVLEDEREVKAFTITATFRQADSAYIRTVPLRASVR